MAGSEIKSQFKTIQLAGARRTFSIWTENKVTSMVEWQ